MRGGRGPIGVVTSGHGVIISWTPIESRTVHAFQDICMHISLVVV
jgi:hypothetical protein